MDILGILGWIVIIIVAVVVYSFMARSKNRREMERNRRDLRDGKLNDSQLKEIYRKLDSYKDDPFFAVASYGLFYKEYYQLANENYEAFKPEMLKRGLLR
ncbi:hypothetical protein [Fundicoccus culcitae]|uniref:Uncharacterized protein n=1 Tax=Fundicoccus culcitae TaxID=2969821 RepID=A0ABY5P4K5_9LACT|nr:hypothetical protein [Fundicoccus culcitae]UUX33479.1 hypothetical protein NRE15_11295 [Fundicoccus culcitae]